MDSTLNSAVVNNYWTYQLPQYPNGFFEGDRFRAPNGRQYILSGGYKHNYDKYYLQKNFDNIVPKDVTQAVADSIPSAENFNG